MPHEPGTTVKQLVKLPKDPEGCWEWLGMHNNRGVPMKQHKGAPIAARRWLWGQLFGEVPPGLEVFGVCGALSCVNPHHMRCGAALDRVQNGALANLTPGDVLEIKRARYAGAYEKAALAMKFGVPRSVLNSIWRGDTWKRVSKVKVAG